MTKDCRTIPSVLKNKQFSIEILYIFTKPNAKACPKFSSSF